MFGLTQFAANSFDFYSADNMLAYCILSKQNFTKSTENHIILLMALDTTHLIMIKAFGDFCQRSFAVLFFFKSPYFSFLFIKTGNSYHSLSVTREML